MKKALIVLAVFVLFGPMLALLGVGVLMNPAAAHCVGTSAGIAVGAVPDELAVTTANGQTFVLNKTQLTRAASIITVGSQIEGVDRDALTIAVMAALTESTLRQLSNTSAYPESGSYPNDGNGGDHDSLGLFQMRPATGWGSVEELMDVDYQVKAFFGGVNGPNHPSPRGLLDIPGWQQMDKGAAAQAVEVSAFPDRYRNYEPVAQAILDALASPSHGAGGGPASTLTGGSRVVFPLPEDSWVMTSPFGVRVHPITGERKMHTGTDFAAADGTPILAVADGTVTVAGMPGGYGGLIVIEHQIDGATVASAYAHMWQHGIHVHVGDHVQTGQHIGDVGSSGMSTGPHLHFEIRPGGTRGEAVGAGAWLTAHQAADLPSAVSGGAVDGCQTGSSGFFSETGLTPPPRNADGSWPVESCTLTDPTQPGRNGACVTRTARIVAQIQAMNTGHNGIYCWDAHAWNPTSDHPKGTACDMTFGAIGRFPSGTDKTNGDRLANWLVANAETWAVKYVIWDGKVWSSARAGDGWRPYTGGGIYNPADATGGHYDHIHLSMH